MKGRIMNDHSFVQILYYFVDKTTFDVTHLDNPKSAIFNTFLLQLIRIFCGLRSRCNVFI